jgi:hypothetical protein
MTTALYQSSASSNVGRLFSHIYCTHKKMNICRPRFIFLPFVSLVFNIYAFIVTVDFVTNELHLSLSLYTYKVRTKKVIKQLFIVLSFIFIWYIYNYKNSQSSFRAYSFLLTSIGYLTLYEKALYHASNAPQQKKLKQNLIQQVKNA